jgi:hypothetical protein
VQEIQDLIEDLRDMYDATDLFVRKSYKDWSEGRYLLYREMATAEAYICTPILSDCSDDNAIKCFEKLVRVHQPPHPSVWREYVKYIMGKSFVQKSMEDDEDAEDDDTSPGTIKEMPGMVVAKFRFIRNLYQRALSSTKKITIEDDSQENIEFNTVIKILCDEFLSFESMFGSQKSFIAASKLVSKKLAPLKYGNAKNELQATPKSVEDHHSSPENKRKREDNDTEMKTDESEQPVDEPKSKRLKIVDTTDVSPVDKDDEEKKSHPLNSFPEEKVLKSTTNIWPIKPKPEHMVKVGKMEYPAHPFTIHVSNLARETMDMDLYDLFRSKCGSIVHVRIFREKHGHDHSQIPVSKCAGLIQFEERESVEEALKLNDEVGLHDKLIAIARSHQPAVGVVPPGMQRKNPKGQGKHTKRNLKRKERRSNAEIETGEEKSEHSNTATKGVRDRDESLDGEKAEKQTNPSNILAFRPRNVGQKKRKKRVGL